MTGLAELLTLSRAELDTRLRGGYPVEPEALAGRRYDGVSLGMPALLERLTWKTFRKAFHREPDGRVRGWNIRMQQDGLEPPWRPKLRGGQPFTFGHFEVVIDDDGHALLDYRRAGNRRLDPTARILDPLVALDQGDASLLLGRTLVAVAGRRVPTPAFFALLRPAELDHVARPAKG